VVAAATTVFLCFLSFQALFRHFDVFHHFSCFLSFRCFRLLPVLLVISGAFSSLQGFKAFHQLFVKSPALEVTTSA